MFTSDQDIEYTNPDSRAIRDEIAELEATAGALGLSVIELAAQRAIQYRDACRQLRAERDHWRAELGRWMMASGAA
jgi:ABC-type uncharacterized transport system substrate-binding protein